jgi:hypothetical protein
MQKLQEWAGYLDLADRIETLSDKLIVEDNFFSVE